MGQAAPPKKRQRSLLSWVSKTTTRAAPPPPLPSAPASLASPSSSSSSSRGFIDAPPGLFSLDTESHVLYLPGLLKGSGGKGGEEETCLFFRRLRREVEWLRRDVTVFNRTTPQRRLVAYHSCREDRLPPYTYSGLTLEPCRATPAVMEALAMVERAAAERCKIFLPAHASCPSSSSSSAEEPPRLFNSCLLNLYRDGGDCMGWHADDETEYCSSSSSAPPLSSRPPPRAPPAKDDSGKKEEPEASSSPPPLARGNSDIVIASTSFGERRDFYLRPKPSKSRAGAARPEGGEEAQQQRHGRRLGQQPPPPTKVRYCLGDGDVLFMLGQTQHRFQHSVPARAKDSKGERINLTFRWNVQVGGEAPSVVCKTSPSN